MARSRSRSRSASPSSEVSDSELFAELDAELDDTDQIPGFDMGEYREKRIAQLQEELRSRPPPSSKQPQAFDLGIDSSQVGRYIKLDTEKEAIALLEKSGRKVVLHFSHAEFQRCKLMDQHLEVRHERGAVKGTIDSDGVHAHAQHLAPMHPGTLFLAVSPLKAPFLVAKMDVKVLPYVVCFVNGKVEDRLVGFEELGNTDQFRRDQLEDRLGKSGMYLRLRRRTRTGTRARADHHHHHPHQASSYRDRNKMQASPYLDSPLAMARRKGRMIGSDRPLCRAWCLICNSTRSPSLPLPPVVVH